MKTNSLRISSILLATMAAFGTAHAQQTGKINFTGQVSAVTCVVQAGDTNKTVSMGLVSPSDFNGTGSVAGTKDFTLTLTGCTTPNTATGHPSRALVKFKGSGINANNYLNLSPGSSTASGVNLRLLNGNSVPILLNESDQQVAVHNLTAGTNVLNFKAEYVATAATVGVGQANSTVDFEVTYP